MFRELSEKIRWRAVIWGWAIAIATGLVLNLVFEAAHILLFSGEVLNAANLTTAVVTISLLSGFLAHFTGGYVAGRRAQTDGGLHGAAVAVLGFIFVVVALVVVGAIVGATAGIVLVESELSLPTLTFGFAGGALLASLALLVFNLVGGFFGGVLGEWEIGPTSTSGGAIKTPDRNQRTR